MTTKGEPTFRGTLVCVVLKAKNLPNKKSIGKQDPYCTLQLGTHTQKTKPDKRGGQHPTWDEQLHFEIYDDMEEQLRNTADASGSVGTSSAAVQKKSRSKTSKTLRVACYADDTKEPEFIGEGVVDLTDTLKSGEFDEWVTIKAKDRYAGEVYLELTFYSAAAPPKKTKPRQPVVPSGTTYGGAGTFSEDFDEYEFAPRPAHRETGHAPIPSYMRNEVQQLSSRSGHPLRPNNSSGMTVSKSSAHLGAPSVAEDIPPSLRPSSSLAQLDTYTPPYAPPNIQREKSPAPVIYPSPSRASFPPLAPSPSSQMHGHRLSDAGPPSMIAQHYQDSAWYGHNAQQQQMPPSISVSTLRPNQPDAYDAVDELNRPLSSMSMGARPAMAEQLGYPSDAYQPQYTQPIQPAYNSTIPPNLPPSGTIDQFGRPAPPSTFHSYSTLPVAIQSGSHLPTPTPPPPSHSAPPSGNYQPQGQTQWVMPPQHQAPLPSNNSQFAPPHLSSVMSVPGRPTSAADVTPNRPHSSSGYHALPQPPASGPPPQQQQHHEQHNLYQQNLTSPADYASALQTNYSSPSSVQRPLPLTSPTGAMVSSPSSSYAPLPPSSSYYPPPAQTPSHYVSVPPMMPWSNPQPAPSSNNVYSSYPPPPPGPSNGGYVHAGPQSTSPSNHPGQYPPPPPMHHVDYSQHQQPQQYYNQSPLPPPPQQMPPPSRQIPSPAPPQLATLPSAPSYHYPQAQHPY